MTIKVVVADDHEVVRSGLANLLKGSDIEIVDEASDGDEAVEKTMKHHPDVVLMDIRMPNRDGLSALEAIRGKLPEARVVMLSTYDNPTYVARSVALGATDFVLKGSTRQELVDVITRAASGDEPLDTSVLRRVKRVMRRRHEREDDGIPLTNRELQVLRHVALGLSNREIGQSLGISIETVKEHVQNILRKLDVNDRTQAAVWAVRRGVV
ncbi:MAG: response regulator transcription factor [Planctomycetaceae bacterium]|nr:response regulator transcription factor [Planctomycetales bacterium]MCB9874104.1 response regulator transcription factor [Planctomycetaceae bacterium]MCB9940557.1 response regulator transcription factor [Planctomycetaceae bacterium]HRX78793.1 response regulator transcription factor [Pirellulaceae bacterium]